jgi:uncharacterized membrane protein
MTTYADTQTPTARTQTTGPGPGPELIIQLAAGFMAAKHLFAASELGLFEALADSPAGLDALAARTGLTRRAARISADAMVTLGLLETNDGTYRNSPAAAAFLAGPGPGDLRPFLRPPDHTVLALQIARSGTTPSGHADDQLADHIGGSRVYRNFELITQRGALGARRSAPLSWHGHVAGWVVVMRSAPMSSPATAATAGLIVVGQVPAMRDVTGISMVIACVAAHRGSRSSGQNCACRRAPGTPANPEAHGLDLRPQPFPARVLHRRYRRRVRGYQIRARVGDTRITYG